MKQRKPGLVEAAQVSKDRYNVGAATQLDVIQAERDLFGAEVSFIQARTDLAGVAAVVFGAPAGVIAVCSPRVDAASRWSRGDSRFKATT